MHAEARGHNLPLSSLPASQFPVLVEWHALPVGYGTLPGPEAALGSGQRCSGYVGVWTDVSALPIAGATPYSPWSEECSGLLQLLSRR